MTETAQVALRSGRAVHWSAEDVDLKEAILPVNRASRQANAPSAVG
jgi:hypothetical protein